MVTVVTTEKNPLDLVINPATRFVYIFFCYFQTRKILNSHLFIPDQYSGQQKKMVYSQPVWMVQ